MFEQNPAAAASWTLIALIVQLAAGVCMEAIGHTAGFVLLLVCWLLNAYAACRLRSLAPLAASIAGAVFAALCLGGLSAGWVGSMVSNLLFLLFYLPLQNRFDRALAAADVSKGTRMIGRMWSYATLVQRGTSMLGFAPLFAGQDALSAQQGSYTPLFTLQLALEVVALIAAVLSYIWMVRYLWRVRGLLKEAAT